MNASGGYGNGNGNAAYGTTAHQQPHQAIVPEHVSRPSSSQHSHRAAPWHPIPTIPSTDAADLILRIAESEARIRTLEEQVTDLRSASLPLPRRRTGIAAPLIDPPSVSASAIAAPTPSSSRGIPANEDGTANDDADVPIAHIRRRPDVRFNDSMLTIHPSAHGRGYPSIIARGLLTVEQVDMAYHTFKHSISRQLPLSAWRSSASPPVKHPFLIIAMLHHVTVPIPGTGTGVGTGMAYTAGDLADLVDESLVVAMKGGATVEVVMALLILAIAPLLPDVADGTVRVRASPVKLITMAWHMAREVGLETDVKQAVRDGVDAGRGEWRELLERVELVSRRLRTKR